MANFINSIVVKITVVKIAIVNFSFIIIKLCGA